LSPSAVESAQFGPLLIGVEDVDPGHLHDERLDGVEGSDQPLCGPGARPRLLRQQRIAALAYVENDGTRFEEGETVLIQDRHLAEGLQGAVFRRVLIALPEEARPVRQAGLLQRPARAQIAHLALCEIRNPAESRDRDHPVHSS
jgi:hypothetical protein